MACVYKNGLGLPGVYGYESESASPLSERHDVAVVPAVPGGAPTPAVVVSAVPRDEYDVDVLSDEYDVPALIDENDVDELMDEYGGEAVAGVSLSLLPGAVAVSNDTSSESGTSRSRSSPSCAP